MGKKKVKGKKNKTKITTLNKKQKQGKIRQKKTTEIKEKEC